MKAKRKIQKTYIIALFLVSLILVAAGTTAVYAKYVKDVPFSGNVHVEADLVESLLLYESKASRTELGDYSLTEASVTENSYILMPGVDIPKDPTIYITGKSAVPAYLYIEVVDDITDSAIHYDLTSDWKITAISGPQGGKVYVYKEVLDGSVKDYTIRIIAENTIEVKEGLKHPGEGFSLSFVAYMAQVPNSTDTPAAVFIQTFNNANN